MTTTACIPNLVVERTSPGVPKGGERCWRGGGLLPPALRNPSRVARLD